MSQSGPTTFGQFSVLFCPQPTRNESFLCTWYDQSTFPVSMWTAITASEVSIAGCVVASPVPKYTAFRTGSTVGEFHTAPPAGPHC